MLKVNHISFDLDGTLINSFPVMRQAWSETMFELGLAVGFEEYKKYIGLPFSRIIEKFGMGKIENEIKKLYFNKTKNYSSQIDTVQGATDILEWCKKNEMTTSIITSKPRVNTQAIVAKKKLNVDFIISGDDLKFGKPFIEPGIKVLEKFDINVENMLYVGDTIFDLQFSQNLGIHFIHFTNEGENLLPKTLVNNVMSISKLMEIKKLAAKINSNEQY